MSRNTNRTSVRKKPTPKATPPSASPPPHFQVQQSTSFAVPTEFVNLPSRGKVYKEGTSLHGVEEVEIKHMTAKEEDIITNQDYIRKGIVFDRVLESVLINKDIRVSEMSDPDKMAVLIAARKTGYGNDYDAEGICEHCGDQTTFTFDLQKVLDNTTNQDDPWIPDFAKHDKEDNTVMIDLPISEIKVQIKIMDMEDKEYLEKLRTQREKLKLEYIHTVENLRRTIVHVNGDSEPETIARFLDFIPARDSRIIKAIQARLQPKIKLSQDVECRSCGDLSEREVPLGGGFFWSEF